MPFKNAPSPTDEVPSLELLMKLKARCEEFKPLTPRIKHALEALERGQTLWKKDVRHVIEALLKQQQDSVAAANQQAQHPKPKGEVFPTDPRKFETLLATKNRVLITNLTEDGLGAEARAIAQQHNVPSDVAEKLIALARERNAEQSLGAAEAQSRRLKAYQALKERLKNGHPVFDADTIKATRELWVIVDNGFADLMCELRARGIPFDPLLAEIPTISTPLRLVPTASPAPAAKASKLHGKGKKGKGARPTPVNPVSEPTHAETLAPRGARNVVKGVQDEPINQNELPGTMPAEAKGSDSKPRA